jgi:hypothetical protein
VRANGAFYTDEKRIRAENAVMGNTKHSVGSLYKIAGCVRTVLRPRNIATLQERGRNLGRQV